MSFVHCSELSSVFSQFMNYQDSSVPNLKTGRKAGDHLVEIGVGR